jgi:SSS family transporter
MIDPNTIVFAAYLLGILILGLVLRKRGRTRGEFFLAGRSMPWFPLGVSVMVTAFSAINMVAFPGEVFGFGLYVTASLPVFVLVAIPVTRVVIPFFHGMQLTSAYEYLERRFDVRVRLLGSGFFVLWRLAWMATVLFATAKFLSAVGGIGITTAIVATGTVAAIYSAAGGMRAVMWTDVAQFFVLFGGIVAALVTTALRAPGGLAGVLERVAAAGRLMPYSPFDAGFLSPDPTLRITLWSGLIGTFVIFAARYVADQTVVQRYFTARSLRDARRGFWWNVVCVLLALTLLAMLGLAAYAHADLSGKPPGALPPLGHIARLFRSLPAGIGGLVVAGLAAATMSSIDSGINACSAAFTTDVVDRLKGRRPDDRSPLDARLGRVLTLSFGVASIVLALVVGVTIGRDQTVFGLVNRVIHGLGSPLLALMALGMFSRRVNATGVFWGGLAGIVFSLFTVSAIEPLALHYYAVVNLIGTVAACYVASGAAGLCGRGNTAEQLGWRIGGGVQGGRGA